MCVCVCVCVCIARPFTNTTRFLLCMEHSQMLLLRCNHTNAMRL